MMNDNDIIKALNHCCGNDKHDDKCTEEKCYQVVLPEMRDGDLRWCRQWLIKDALDLIIQQQAEIERLKLESQEPEDAGYYLQLEHEKMVLDALEKQMPKKANISIKGTTDYNTTAHCPTCHKMLTGIKPRHCIECGQAIDWSDEKCVID